MDPLDHMGEGFPAATRADWLERVIASLKGRDYDSLVTRNADAITFDPLPERAADARPLPGRAPSAPWSIVQRADHPDAAEANRLALADLEGGASGLTLVLSGAPSAYGYGLPPEAGAIERALEGVFIEGIDLMVEPGPGGRAAAEAVAGLAETRGLDPTALTLSLGFDPIGLRAATGRAPAEDAAVLAGMQGDLAGRGFTARAFRADGRAHNAAGASEAQELAAILATALAYLRASADAGQDVTAGAASIALMLAADTEQVLTLAKFRAMRLLWTRVLEESGAGGAPIRIEAETAWRQATRRDPHVNLLRGTLGAFAAGLGGADAVTVLPFTAALGLPDAFARRLARNTQLLLIEEANLHRVADPAAGSGAVEDATEKLCGAAWDLFRQIERAGGMTAMLESGAWQARIAETAAARAARITVREETITGTSRFPHLDEMPVAVLDVAAHPGEAGDGALHPRRFAEPFEAMRDRADAVLAETGARPRIFIAGLGPLARHAERAGFAADLFAAGGIEAARSEPLDGAEAARAAFAGSGARIACLAGTDEDYVALAEPVARALAEAGAARIYVTGREGEAAERLVAAGVHAHIFAGCDALDVLRDALEAAHGES